jgi:hypothetical protein
MQTPVDLDIICSLQNNLKRFYGSEVLLLNNVPKTDDPKSGFRRNIERKN